MYTINKSNNSVLISNEYLEKVFKDRSLKSIKVEGEYNCCTELPTIKYNTDYPVDKCIYNSTYANFEGQAICGENPNTRFNGNCENPLGSYYRNLSELYLFVDGKEINILNKTYDVSIELDELINFVNAYLKSKNFNATYEAYVSTNITGFLTFTDKFINLPSKVIPLFNILANEETCFVNSEYNCNKGEVCVKNKIDLINYHAYSITSFKIANLTYTPFQPVSTFTLDAELNTINQWLINNNINDILEVEENGIVSKGTLQSIILDDNTLIESECVELELPNIECIYEATLDLDLQNVNGIRSFNFYTDSSFSNSISTISLEILELEEIENHINSKIQGTLSISKNNNIITFRIENAIEEPDRIVFSNDSFISFSCTNLSYFNDSYKPELIQFTNNGIKLTEAYLNGFKTGVYGFTVTIETEDSVISDKFCLFNDQDLKCKIANIKDPKDLVYAYSLYEALHISQDCIDCECEQSCIIYKELLDFLESLGYETRDCGC